MNKFLRIIVIFLLVRVDWRKLLFFGAIFTVTAIFVQTSTLPYPLTKQNMSPPVTVSSYFKPLNGTLRLFEATPLVRNEHFEPIRSFSKVVAIDSSEKVIQSAPILKKGGKAVRNRTSRRHASATATLPAWPSTPSRPVPGHILRHLRAMTPDEALLFAKKEIENITIETEDNDPDLYAPVFRNVSVFKRSYELMEWILKVYIYKEGDRPIFHEPHLQGIYSSEGWFMKIMEGYRHFITTDPQKAHLFYLPYSARQLQKALYVPNSHHMKPLSIFLRDYVNMLASKYPFWNRTHGRDHFLVACHDWGPYTLTEHEELTLNTIKALCNADISEGIFKAGKDVSLPETTIRNPGKPLRYIGGKRVSQRPILAFYAGRSHGRVRPRLLRYWRNRDGSDKDPDMRINGPLSKRESRIMSYVEHMKSSKYCICPMGFEVNSPRIVESIYYECVPVIIADNFAPPLSDVFDWSVFSVTVAEKDIPKLKEILVAIPLKKYLTMQANVKMLQRHFAWNAAPVKYDMFHMILHSIWLSRLNQIQASQST